MSCEMPIRLKADGMTLCFIEDYNRFPSYLYLAEMNLRRNSTILIIPVVFVIAFIVGCKPRHIHKREIISFKPYFGIKYIEVQRKLNNGLSFSEFGYQLKPEWQLEFLANDSTRIYSPVKKALINFPLSRGYDSVFNTARTWYKMRKMSKDSLVLEILRFKGDSIDLTGNKVFMKFYAKNYITNVLHTDTGVLRRPSARDTAYVKKLIALSLTDSTKAFAATSPVQLISTSPKLTIEKKVTEPDMLNNFDTSDDYLFPQFYLVVYKANDTFNYSFSVYVDDKCNITFGRALVSFAYSGEGYKKDYIKKCKGLISGYLKYYVRAVPGRTLGIKHISEIGLNIKGRQDN